MKLKNKKIGICIPELPNNKNELLKQVKKLSDIEKISIIPIIDLYNLKSNIDLKEFIEKLEMISSNKIISTVKTAKKIGQSNMLDIILIIPCSENVIPKLSYNIFDKPTLEIAKYQLINDKPIVLGISANNALSSNAENIGKLLNRKNCYFIPFKQSNPITKPYFITFEYSYIFKTLEEALGGKQIQPIILSM